MATPTRAPQKSASRSGAAPRKDAAQKPDESDKQNTSEQPIQPDQAEKKASSKKAHSKKADSKKTGSKQSGPSDDRLVDFYTEMMQIRRFEERAARAYTQALVGGYCHLNLGEEAAVVGLMTAMRPSDYLFTNYREHGYAIARGIDPNRVMAELYGRIDGVSKGWGGSMHMFDVTQRLLGGYGIVGGQLPLATGAALAIDYRDQDDIVLCTMGDGTTNIGAFHESLNIAAIWNLPVVFVIINNKLGMGTTVEAASGEPELYKRASSYRMASERVDGLDPVKVYDAAQRAIESARAGKPFLLEVMTERLRGHSVVDPAKYRSPEEVALLAENDPVHTFADRLLADGILTEDDLKKIDTDATARAAEAAAFAEASPFPDVSTLFDYTYATPVPNDSRRLPGQPLFEPESRPASATTPAPAQGAAR